MHPFYFADIQMFSHTDCVWPRICKYTICLQTLLYHAIKPDRPAVFQQWEEFDLKCILPVYNHLLHVVYAESLTSNGKTTESEAQPAVGTIVGANIAGWLTLLMIVVLVVIVIFYLYKKKQRNRTE